MARSAIGEPYGVAKWHWRRMRRVALETAWADDFFGRGRIRLGGAGGCDRMGAFWNRGGARWASCDRVMRRIS